MARFAGKHTPRKYVFLFAIVALLGIVLVADFLWASTSSSSSSFSRYWSTTSVRLLDNVNGQDSAKGKQTKGKLNGDKRKISKYLNATFADLPAPQLEWEEMAEAPVPRLDGAAVQIKNLLYVFAGYGTIDYVHSHVDIYNFSDNTWGGRFDTPKEMANSHLGMATDGRYIYAVTGQFGPQCRGPTNRNFVLDTEMKVWHELPPLPVPRYAPATQLWRGRLHVMGGSKEDRHEPGLEHWSLAVKDGKALEKEWQNEIPIPRGGPHRACAVANDKLYVIGGQEGDFMAKPGSPIFKCSRRHEMADKKAIFDVWRRDWAESGVSDRHSIKHLSNRYARSKLSTYMQIEGVLDEEVGIEAVDGEDLGMVLGAYREGVGGGGGLKEVRMGEGVVEGVVGDKGGGGVVEEEGGAVKSKAEVVAMGLPRVMGQ
ncbi:putative kelch repeat-containing protein [Cocos nucifera]|uniref:Putative kelch repeat-containing protein n=1 Tax=Cocos nucifera TaxID=13894 RepID=A0A8K0INU1_COCNU|nr:putative kelch repeat-containing protein [Cocos nucifera]